MPNLQRENFLPNKILISSIFYSSLKVLYLGKIVLNGISGNNLTKNYLFYIIQIN